MAWCRILTSSSKKKQAVRPSANASTEMESFSFVLCVTSAERISGSAMAVLDTVRRLGWMRVAVRAINPRDEMQTAFEKPGGRYRIQSQCLVDCADLHSERVKGACPLGPRPIVVGERDSVVRVPHPIH